MLDSDIQNLDLEMMDGILAALKEGLITKDLFFKLSTERDIQNDRKPSEADCKYALFGYGLIGVNAFRAGLIPMDELTAMNIESRGKWVDTWLNQYRQINLTPLRQYKDYLMNWEKTGASSREDLKARLSALGSSVQYSVVSISTTLATAEIVTEKIANNPLPNMSTFNLSDAELNLSRTIPAYSTNKNYEQLIMEYFLKSKRSSEFACVFAIALTDKLLTVNDLTLLIDSFSGDSLTLGGIHWDFDRAETLIALREGLITLADFHNKGTFGRRPSTFNVNPIDENYRLLAKNNCSLLRIYHEFIKENW